MLAEAAFPFPGAGHVRVRSGMRIVRNHHDRLLKILIQSLQDLQHFCRGVAVQIASRFVCQATKSDR